MVLLCCTRALCQPLVLANEFRNPLALLTHFKTKKGFYNLSKRGIKNFENKFAIIAQNVEFNYKSLPFRMFSQLRNEIYTFWC